MEKKKILVLIDWFAPGFKAGGPIQSCVNFSLAMKKAYSVYVLTTDTDHGETEPYPGITPDRWTNDFDPDVQVCYLRKKNLSAAKIKAQIALVKPDFVYLNHMFSPLFVVYPLWLALRGQLGARVVVCPRGALYDSALNVKRWKKTPFLGLFSLLKVQKKVLFHATNQREEQAILQHFPGSRVIIADQLPNVNQRPFSGLAKLPGELRCIFIARIVPIKNLLFLLNVLEKIDFHLVLSVIGPVEDKEYWKECQQQIDRLPANIHVNYLGAKNNSELPLLLHEHHLFILPTTGENFGHAIFEALLAGRPVLISDQTPWLDLATARVGWDLSLNDPDAFAAAIRDMGGWGQEHFDVSARAAWVYARNFINDPELTDRYYKLFE
jgi:glycosyltransferase involved in cell wall biosynthesis